MALLDKIAMTTDMLKPQQTSGYSRKLKELY